MSSPQPAARASAGTTRPVVAFVHPAPIGHGGLGRVAEDVVRALVANGATVHAFGPSTPPDVRARLGREAVFHEAPPPVPRWATRYSWLRWLSGRHTYLHARGVGRWAAREVARLQPSLCYCFAEAALETLRLAKERGIPTILDSPTGHISALRAAAIGANRRAGARRYFRHPTPAMVARVTEEYALADRIRVASTFSRRSMAKGGVPESKISIVAYPIDVTRYRLPAERPAPAGRLRASMVSTLSLPKGFPQLIDAVRRVGDDHVDLRLAGGTDSRLAYQELVRRGEGMKLTSGPVADVREAYHAAELFVLPTLHDGYGYVVAEAMACGLPVVVTKACGAADLVEHGRTGWIVPEDDVEALAEALRDALRRRGELAAMGDEARRAVEARATGDDLGAWALGGAT